MKLQRRRRLQSRSFAAAGAGAAGMGRGARGSGLPDHDRRGGRGWSAGEVNPFFRGMWLNREGTRRSAKMLESPASRRPTSRSCGATGGALAAEVVDFEGDDVAGVEIARGLHAEADAGRSAGGDDVAGLEGHELREVVDQMRHVEDHRARVAVLAGFVVDPEAKAEVGRVGNFVGRDEPGAERVEGVAGFPLGPLAAAFELESAFGNVVGNAVAGDAGGGVGERGEDSGFRGR